MNTQLALVLSSPIKENSIALLKQYCDFIDKFDVFYLSSEPKEKILKKDVDLDLNKLKDYSIVCTVGAESLKYVCGLTGITKYNASIVEGKYVPVLDPNMVFIKPQYEADIKKAFLKIEQMISGKIISPSEKYYKHFTYVEEFEPFLEKMEASEIIGVDTESTSLSPRKGDIIGFVFSTKPNEGVFVDSDVVEHFYDRIYNLFKNKTVVFHNAKFDIGFIQATFGFVFDKFEDTMLMHYILDETQGTHGLKQLALKYTDLGDYEKDLDTFKKEWCRRNKIKLEDFNYGMIPIEILSLYACKDGDATMQLFHKFKPLIDKNPKFSSLYENLLKPAVKTLVTLEDNGGPINLEELDNLIRTYRIEIEETINELKLYPAVVEFENKTGKSFNPNSVYHLRELFFDILKLKPIKKTDTGAFSTDAEVLEALKHPVSEAILDLRKKVKLSQTYLKNIREGVDNDSRLRSSFNLTGTTSGRLSSSGVLNYQNLPRDKDTGIKRVFKANPNYSIVQCD